MFQLVETIRYENGTFHNLDLHEARLNRSRAELFPNSKELSLTLSQLITIEPKSEITYKVRVLYRETIEEVQWHEYHPASISSLKVIHCDDIEYHIKSTNREKLNELSKQSGDGDSILIVKNGMVSDSAFTNIVFFDGNEWITPDSPLLRGVMRESLIRNNTISERSIPVEMIKSFTAFKLINAMIPFDRAPLLPIDSIII